MLNDSQSSFIERLASKFAIVSLLNIPERFKDVATLSYKISMFKKLLRSGTEWSMQDWAIQNSEKILYSDVRITEFIEEKMYRVAVLKVPQLEEAYAPATKQKKRRCGKMSLLYGLSLMVCVSQLVKIGLRQIYIGCY